MYRVAAGGAVLGAEVQGLEIYSGDANRARLVPHVPYLSHAEPGAALRKRMQPHQVAALEWLYERLFTRFPAPLDGVLL